MTRPIAETVGSGVQGQWSSVNVVVVAVIAVVVVTVVAVVAVVVLSSGSCGFDCFARKRAVS